MTHGTTLTNLANVYIDETESRPGNNSYQFVVEVRDDVDLAITKSGVGESAIGEDYQYFLDYANWGGAPADNVVISDTLPTEVSFIEAIPSPTSNNGGVLTWDVGSLVGGQWAGQIEIRAEVINSGTVINVADIDFPGVDVDLGNNSDDHTEEIDDILPPLITQPTQGTTDTTPTVKGLAPSEAVVDLWDISTATHTWIMSTTATVSGTWTLTPTFARAV